MVILYILYYIILAWVDLLKSVIISAIKEEIYG